MPNYPHGVTSVFFESQNVSQVLRNVPKITEGQCAKNDKIKIRELFLKINISYVAVRQPQPIGEIICLDVQPYSIVEDNGFARLLKHLTPNYKIPSQKHFSMNVIPLMYETIKSKIKYEIY